MFCKKCGKELHLNSKFCAGCGEKTFEKISELSKLKNPQRIDDTDSSGYRGLSGWLILVILGLFITTGYSGYQFLDTFFGDTKYGENTGLFAYDFFSMGLLTALAVYVIYLFFAQKSTFPKYYFSLLISLMVVNIVTLMIASAYSVAGDDFAEYTNNVARSVVQAIIWGMYIFKSKRVKATFIN